MNLLYNTFIPGNKPFSIITNYDLNLRYNVSIERTLLINTGRSFRFGMNSQEEADEFKDLCLRNFLRTPSIRINKQIRKPVIKRVYFTSNTVKDEDVMNTIKAYTLTCEPMYLKSDISNMIDVFEDLKNRGYRLKYRINKITDHSILI